MNFKGIEQLFTKVLKPLKRCLRFVDENEVKRPEDARGKVLFDENEHIVNSTVNRKDRLSRGFGIIGGKRVRWKRRIQRSKSQGFRGQGRI